jgi:DnaJ family protein C protein 9
MLEVVEQLFSTRDLYQVLSISSEDADDAKKLRNAFLRAALRYHPDKAPNDSSATQKFQVLNSVYEILKDSDTKKVYDATGEWPSEKFEIDLTHFDVRIDMNAVEQFKKEYQGSETEREDIKKCYAENQGSFIKIFDSVFFINVIDDLERVTKIIEDAIEAGEIKRASQPKGYPFRWKKYLAKCQREAKEAEEILASMHQRDSSRRRGGKDTKDNNEESLSALILQRGEERSKSFLEQLEAKYGDSAPQDKKRRKISKK